LQTVRKRTYVTDCRNGVTTSGTTALVYDGDHVTALGDGNGARECALSPDATCGRGWLSELHRRQVRHVAPTPHQEERYAGFADSAGVAVTVTRSV